jgi:hypothetical protein
MLVSMLLEQPRYTGMPPDPLLVALVWNETTFWLQKGCENGSKFWLGSSSISKPSKSSRTELGVSSLDGYAPQLQNAGTSSELRDFRLQVVVHFHTTWTSLVTTSPTVVPSVDCWQVSLLKKKS